MAHSIIPPSSAGIWGKPGGCTGWVLMAQTYPETEESEAAKEGTAAHEIAERMILAKARAGHGYPTREDTVGAIATNGVVYTDEMYDAAEIYAADVAAVMRETGVFGGDHFGVETHIEAPLVHELSRGTVDAFVYSQKQRALYIWDFKFGYTHVEAYENWQAINYLAGLIDTLGIDGHTDQYTTVHVRIVQPRAYHRDGPIREWVIKASDMRQYFNVLSANAHKALGAGTEYNSGSHCRYCPGRHACPAALKAGVQLYEAATQPTPVELDAESLAVQYGIVTRARAQLEYLESAFEEQIKSRIRRGENVRGYAVIESSGRERWARPAEEIIALGDLLGHDLREPKVKTPNQVRKLGIDDSVIMAYSERPRTGLKLVPDDENRARRIFGATK